MLRGSLGLVSPDDGLSGLWVGLPGGALFIAVVARPSFPLWGGFFTGFGRRVKPLASRPMTGFEHIAQHDRFYAAGNPGA